MRRFLAVALCLWSFAAWGQREPSGLMLGGNNCGNASVSATLVGRWLACTNAGVSGTVATDLSGNGNAGTLVNSPTVTSAQIGSGLNFVAASSQYVSTTLSTAIGTGDYSITISMKTSTSQLANFFGKRLGSGTFQQFTVFMSDNTQGASGNLIGFADRDGTNNRSGVSSTTYADGKFHFIRLTRTSTATTLFVDEVQQATSATTVPNLNRTDPMFIGVGGNGSSPGTTFATAVLNDARAYAVALSVAQGSQIYNAWLNGHASNDKFRTRDLIVVARGDVLSVANSNHPLLNKLLRTGS